MRANIAQKLTFANEIMEIKAQQLSQFSNPEFNRGASRVKQVLWLITSAVFFKSFLPFNALKILLLRAFGAQIGKGLIIKPHVNIKFPWKLSVKNHVWIGEKVWIDNLDFVTIEDNVCISQGAMLLCGNHNYKSDQFELITKPIHLKTGVWICAKAVVGPGVVCMENALLLPLSFADKNLEKNNIYQGNPAKLLKPRF